MRKKRLPLRRPRWVVVVVAVRGKPRIKIPERNHQVSGGRRWRLLALPSSLPMRLNQELGLVDSDGVFRVGNMVFSGFLNHLSP